MFPFLNIKKIIRNYKIYSNSNINTVFSISNYEKIYDINKNKKFNSKMDIINNIGAFTIFSPKKTIKLKKKFIKPFSCITLSSIELVNLRSKLDIDFYNLIVNSGIKIDK